VRYREDDSLDANGNVTNVRARLTLTEAGKQRKFTTALLLSRSRYISPATRTLRFYREYFHADSERTIVKERRRWHIDYLGLRLYVNVDQLLEPSQEGFYLELKSRTWSPKDAEHKAGAIHDLLRKVGIAESDIIDEDYATLRRSG
jgi:5-methylthioadenosine/S-adenosylhomocysteine deaminase